MEKENASRVNLGEEERRKKSESEKNEDISLECQHFGVGNENTNLVICDIATKEANQQGKFRWDHPNGERANEKKTERKRGAS